MTLRYPTHRKQAMKNQNIIQGKTQIEKARQIKATLGCFTAARYMAKRGWSLECARFVLLGV